MSTSDLLSSTLNWPGKGQFGLKSSVLQTSSNDLVKQNIVSDHMRNHYRRLNNARSAVDTKPPKAMILGQKCRDRARKEMAQLAYTQVILNQFTANNASGSARATPRGRSSQSARSQRFVQSQPATYRARSRSIESARRVTRSLNMNGSMQNLSRQESNGGNIAQKLFGGGVMSQALTTMAALGKMTSTERNRSSADVLDKHPDFFSQPKETEHQPRLVKRDGDSFLRNNRTYYNPPSRSKARSSSAAKEASNPADEKANETKHEDDDQLALSIRRVREQLNRSLELRHNVEKKIKKAKASTAADSTLRKQSDQTLRQFGLTEQERLEYVRFMQDITDAIVRKNLTTEPAIEKLFEIHIDQKRGTLDERRLRDLLEALKEDLGVRSSRKNDKYASVHRATAYDRDPLPPPVPLSTRDESLMLTPTTPHDQKRRLSYDVNQPLPWQAENDSSARPTITPRATHESKRDSLQDNRANAFDDDHLFSGPAKPKPRASLQRKPDEHPPSSHPLSNALPMDESEPNEMMNFQATMTKPKADLHDTNWLADGPPTRVLSEVKAPPHDLPGQSMDEERRSPSPGLNNDTQDDQYDGDEFDEDEISEP